MIEPIRVLLDEGVPERLRRSFSENFVVETVGYREWEGLKNGELLRAAEEHFDFADRKRQCERIEAPTYVAVRTVTAETERFPTRVR